MFGDLHNLASLTTVIVHAAAPAFLLGAVASFLSILTARLERVTDRIRSTGIANGDPLQWRRRVGLLNDAIYLAVLSAVTTAGLLILAFMLAFFGLQHAYGVGAMFILALLLLMAGLVQFMREVRIATRMTEID